MIEVSDDFEYAGSELHKKENAGVMVGGCLRGGSRIGTG